MEPVNVLNIKRLTADVASRQNGCRLGPGEAGLPGPVGPDAIVVEIGVIRRGSAAARRRWRIWAIYRIPERFAGKV